METGAAPEADFLDLLSRDVFLPWEVVGGVLMVVFFHYCHIQGLTAIAEATSFLPEALFELGQNLTVPDRENHDCRDTRDASGPVCQ